MSSEREPRGPAPNSWELETVWIERLKQGDEEAAQRLWRAYHGRLIRLARRRLGASKRRVADEEDVVLSAFESFLRAAADGRFPSLKDRHDLWQLLLVLTTRKASNQARGQRALKRGGGRVRGESAFGDDRGGDRRRTMNDVPDPRAAAGRATADDARDVAEQLSRLLAMLPDPTLRTIAIRKLEGLENQAIADELGCAPRTVERKLNLIRNTWREADE